MKIAVKKENLGNVRFEGDEYVIDLSREFGGYEKGDLVCYITPWIQMPLTLQIAIRANGDLVFRCWEFKASAGPQYLHYHCEENLTVTPAQIDTVNGLFSGRIKFDGLKLPIGASLQKICPIDLKKEEKLVGHKIYIA